MPVTPLPSGCFTVCAELTATEFAALGTAARDADQSRAEFVRALIETAVGV